MKHTVPIIAASALLPACATVKGAASDTKAVGKTAVQMVRDIPDFSLPELPLPRADHSPFKEETAKIIAYCDAINKRWEVGKEQVKIGEQLLSEGQARLEKGRRLMRDGERRVATGELALEEARRDLTVRTGRAKPETQDYAEMQEPEFLKIIRIKLENAIERMESGNEQIARGASEVAIGQERADQGIERLRDGHALLTDDEGRCREIKVGKS